MDQNQPQVELPGGNFNVTSNGTLPQPGDRLPPAVEEASAGRWDSKHFINIRLSIPLIFMRLYITLVAGKERRCKTRRRAERAKHPLGTLGNTFFFSTTSALISLAGLAVIIVATVLIIRQLFSFEITVR
jgi:hypothetical protein